MLPVLLKKEVAQAAVKLVSLILGCLSPWLVEAEFLSVASLLFSPAHNPAKQHCTASK
jgi:hypothetical protein